MSQLLQTLKKAQITIEQIKSILKAFKINPFNALAEIQELNLSSEVLQELMRVAMIPGEIDECIKELGLDTNLADQIKAKLNSKSTNDLL